MDQQTKIGIGVMIFKEGKILLGARKGAHGAGEYAFPGGHLEFMEDFADCARRETMEECGIEIDDIDFQCVANVKGFAPKHYVHIGLVADWKSGEPTVIEPEKCAGWDWYALDELPSPLFAPCITAIESHLTGRAYFDAPDVPGALAS